MAEYQENFNTSESGNKALYVKYLNIASSNDEEPNKLKLSSGGIYTFVTGVSGKFVRTNYQRVPGIDMPETLACFDTFTGKSYENAPEEKFVIHIADVDATGADDRRPLHYKRPLYQGKSLDILLQLATLITEKGWEDNTYIFAISVSKKDSRYNKVVILDKNGQPVPPLYSFDDKIKMGLISTVDKPLSRESKSATRKKVIDKILKDITKAFKSDKITNLVELYESTPPTSAQPTPVANDVVEDGFEDDPF